jgi:hypothetical protein
MARLAQVVVPGIPHYITQQENRRHGSGNEYGVARILTPLRCAPGLRPTARGGVRLSRRSVRFPSSPHCATCLDSDNRACMRIT